jgi:6-pyruvoyltetrahydropterin/6-carboxytetrahydropterin synthase
LHGYALKVQITFEAEELDERNWVVDFGGLKDLKEWLVKSFDHTTCVAIDDPELETFEMLRDKGLIDLRVMPNIGIEWFAKSIFQNVDGWLSEQERYRHRVRVMQVEVSEHDGNSAYVRREV